MEDGLLAPLTSVSPSTTSSALTTLWTGQSPATHGILGYEVWLKEYGMIANMILHAPMTFRGEVGSLSKAGFDPQEFLPLPTLGPHLRRHDIQPYAFQHHSIAHSGLSQMFQREVDIHGFYTPADLWVSMRQLIENKPHERQYIWAYWGEVDGLSHRYSPDDERAVAEFSQFSAAFERFFLNQLSPQARKDTLVVLTADHGQIHTPLVTNHTLIPLLGVVDVWNQGYSSYEPEFAQMIREGRAERGHWRNVFEMVEYAARSGRFVRRAVSDGLARLDLRPADVGLPEALFG